VRHERRNKMGKYSEASAGNLELEKALDSFGGANVATKAITYAAATTGATGAADLFNVEGDVLVYVFGICHTNIAGAGTLEVGVAGATAAIIAQIADATDLDANEGYWDATPTLAEGIAPVYHVVAGGMEIIQTIGTTALTAGQITYYCFWKPLSSDGVVSGA